MEEIWKPIPGYEGYYEVSNTGKVRGLTRIVKDKNGRPRTIKGKELIPQKEHDGYYRVGLRKNNISKHWHIHRLVALAFIPNPDNLPIVNHKDENKINNNVNNLEWCSYQYNANYGTSQQRLSQSHSKPVIMCDIITHQQIKEFPNALVATEELGYKSYTGIYRVLNGKQKSSLGYWWKYKE